MKYIKLIFSAVPACIILLSCFLLTLPAVSKGDPLKNTTSKNKVAPTFLYPNGIDPNESSAVKLLARPDGKIIVVTSRGAHQISANGSLDYSFSEVFTDSYYYSSESTLKNGKKFDDAHPHYYEIFDAALQNDQKLILVGGTVNDPRKEKDEPMLIIARFMPNGRPDHDFGVDGIQKVIIKDAMLNIGSRVVIQSDDRLLVTGSLYIGKEEKQFDLYLVKFLSNGEVDKSYGFNGVLRPKIDDHTYGLDAAIALKSDDSVLFAKPVFFESHGAYVPKLSVQLAEFSYGGKFVKSFGENGALQYRGASDKQFFVRNIIVTVGGDFFVLGGVRDDNSKSIFACGIASFKANGAVNMLFGHDGLATFAKADNECLFSDALLIDKSLLVASGYYWSNNDDIDGHPEHFFVKYFSLDGKSIGAGNAADFVSASNVFVSKNAERKKTSLIQQGDQFLAFFDCNSEVDGDSNFCKQKQRLVRLKLPTQNR